MADDPIGLGLDEVESPGQPGRVAIHPGRTDFAVEVAKESDRRLHGERAGMGFVERRKAQVKGSRCHVLVRFVGDQLLQCQDDDK